MNSIYHGGVRVITSKPFTPELQLSIIEKYNVTILYNTPFIMAACLKSDSIRKLNVSSVKRIVFYGSKLPNTLVADINQRFPNADFLVMYGLTEVIYHLQYYRYHYMFGVTEDLFRFIRVGSLHPV